MQIIIPSNLTPALLSVSAVPLIFYYFMLSVNDAAFPIYELLLHRLQ